MAPNDLPELPPAVMQALSATSAAALARRAIQENGLQALQRLVPLAHGTSGQARVLARFLLSQYNGNRFPFDLMDFRALDTDLFADCLAVLQMNYRPEQPLYAYYKNGHQIWEKLAHNWRFTDHQNDSWR